MQLNEILRTLRINSGKTQKEIADILGTTFQYYSKYERGIYEIPFQRVLILSKFYNVSLDYIVNLLNDSESLKKSNQSIQSILDENESKPTL